MFSAMKQQFIQLEDVNFLKKKFFKLGTKSHVSISLQKKMSEVVSSYKR